MAAEKVAAKAAGNFVVGPSSFVGTVAASSSLLGKGVDSRTVAPKSVREAMLRDDFDAPFGWKFALDKEVERVQSHKAWRLVPIRHMRDARRKYGDARVSCG